MKKRQKYPPKRAAVGHSSVKEKGWEKELDKMEKKWQKTKSREIKKAEKMQAENNDQDWIQVQGQADEDGWIQV